VRVEDVAQRVLAHPQQPHLDAAVSIRILVRGKVSSTVLAHAIEEPMPKAECADGGMSRCGDSKGAVVVSRHAPGTGIHPPMIINHNDYRRSISKIFVIITIITVTVIIIISSSTAATTITTQ
jgi:hypothetical protein